jgi:PIN domain nuclease of toxin-antitoxin system
VLKRGLVENDYEELVITSTHAMGVGQLPAIHKDPFDRVLVAQAAAEGLLLLTADEVVAQYPGPIRLV